MKPKLRRPSPAMVVSLVALVMATTGSAIAAVNYATNAGAVDGKSAVKSGATLKQAAGRLVATQRTGSDRGRIATKYLDLDGYLRGSSGTFGRAFEVADNATGAPAVIGGIPGVGALTSTCADQAGGAGVEDPITTISLSNVSGGPLNVARTIGGGAPDVFAQQNGTQSAFNIGGSNTFEFHIESKGTSYLIEGVVRQDGRRTPAAACVVYGFALAVRS
jgi:hypothetical protein